MIWAILRLQYEIRFLTKIVTAHSMICTLMPNHTTPNTTIPLNALCKTSPTSWDVWTFTVVPTLTQFTITTTPSRRKNASSQLRRPRNRIIFTDFPINESKAQLCNISTVFITPAIQRDRSCAHKKQRQDDQIFINGDLTDRRAKLSFDARALKHEKKIADCWTHPNTPTYPTHIMSTWN